MFRLPFILASLIVGVRGSRIKQREIHFVHAPEASAFVGPVFKWLQSHCAAAEPEAEFELGRFHTAIMETEITSAKDALPDLFRAYAQCVGEIAEPPTAPQQSKLSRMFSMKSSAVDEEPVPLPEKYTDWKDFYGTQMQLLATLKQSIMNPTDDLPLLFVNIVTTLTRMDKDREEEYSGALDLGAMYGVVKSITMADCAALDGPATDKCRQDFNDKYSCVDNAASAILLLVDNFPENGISKANCK